MYIIIPAASRLRTSTLPILALSGYKSPSNFAQVLIVMKRVVGFICYSRNVLTKFDYPILIVGLRVFIFDCNPQLVRFRAHHYGRK